MPNFDGRNCEPKAGAYPERKSGIKKRDKEAINAGKVLEHESLTDKIIKCAIEVHKKLGPGFLESIYENAFIIEFQKQNLQVERQREIVIQYDGVKVGRHRLDIIVNDTIVVELKTVKNIEDVHFAIVKSYLKALGKEHGLIINFSKKVIEVKRVIYK